ncbi:helix-turn-helix transcriptional regulator [Streptomyces sp. NPDC003077]|uniref:helix-turn-helix domain-containing protein n=1 Tax=Streptomyces sp. NPDC003077 TaxID=3154443 RepID=UPI0033A95393
MRRRKSADSTTANTAEVFGELLKHYREAAGLTQEQLAPLLPCDRSTLGRFELGTRVPPRELVARCDELLNTGGALEKLWLRIDWYPVVEHPDWFRRRAAMDAEAVALRIYQTHVVPGILQTERYARALFKQVADREPVEERVRARLSRQQRFLEADGPLLVAILDESCIRYVIGEADVMREQCRHLLTISERANVRVKVAPFNRPSLTRPNTSMTLIQLPDGQKWVYSESLDRGHFNGDPAAYDQHSRDYDELWAGTMSTNESAALISEIMEGYAQHDQERFQRGDLDQVVAQRTQRRGLHRDRPRYPRRRPRT